jgi:hypothetical protein
MDVEITKKLENGTELEVRSYIERSSGRPYDVIAYRVTVTPDHDDPVQRGGLVLRHGSIEPLIKLLQGILNA